MKIIRQALGRCMKKKDLKNTQTQQVVQPTTVPVTYQEPWQPMHFASASKGYGFSGYGKGFGGSGKGGKGKSKWSTGKTSWGGKGSNQQGQMNLTQFSREIECFVVDEQGGKTGPASFRIFCPFENLPGGCSRHKAKGGKACKFNHTQGKSQFTVYRTSTIDQTMQQFERWCERNGAKLRKIHGNKQSTSNAGMGGTQAKAPPNGGPTAIPPIFQG